MVMLAALGGCAEDPATDDTLADVDALEPYASFEFEGADIAQARAVVLAVYAGGIGGEFRIKDDAQELLVEAQWTCLLDACPMDLMAADDDYDQWDYSSGDLSARLIMDELESDTWFAWLAPPQVSAHAMMEGVIRVTVFYDGPVPEGFTAFE